MSVEISIIIPVYNSAPYLRECLDSVRGQTIKDWECICIDDGSTDGSAAILDEYAEDDSRFKVIHQPNKGVSAARQLGLDTATGKYIGWVDSDDTIDPSHFEALYEKIEATNADMVWCGYRETRDGVETKDWMECEPDSKAMLEKLIRADINGFLVSKLFRRKFLEKWSVRFPDGQCQMMEDTFFLVSMLVHKPNLDYVHATSYHYIVRGGSLSNQGGTEAWWRKVLDADNRITSLIADYVYHDALRYRAAKLKLGLFWAKQVPGSMFYSFHKDIRWLPSELAGLKLRIAYFLATLGLRKLLLKVI